MSGLGDTTQSVPPQIIRCLKCGTYIPSSAIRCPECSTTVAPGTVEISPKMQIAPLTLPEFKGVRETGGLLPQDASVLLRLLGGEVFSFSVKQPLVLGRGAGFDVNALFDLTYFKGRELGVSRQHCKLYRDGTRLYVSDLDSTNGTFLNDRQLAPYEQYKLSHGDRLTLGTLQVLVLFSNKG